MQNTVHVVLGKKGSGKTTLTREIIREHPRVIVLDVLKEYGPECGCTPVYEEECPDAVLAALKSKRYRLSLRCFHVDDNLDLMRLAYECPRTLVVVEEASMYGGASQLPDEMAQLIRYGRHRELDLIFVARRPSELPRDITANADILVSFRQQEPRDLLYMRSYFGDAANGLPALPDYGVLVFTPNGDLSDAPKCVLRRIAGESQPYTRNTELDGDPGGDDDLTSEDDAAIETAANPDG